MHFHNNTHHGQRITELYIAAAKSNELLNKRDPNLLIQKFESHPLGFAKERGAFTNLLVHYHTSYRHLAAGVLHDIFSTARSEEEPPIGSVSVDAVRLNAIHEMLGLQVGEVALSRDHPVLLEYAPAPGQGIRRVFPSEGKLGVQVFTKHTDPQSETAKFIEAMGGFR